MSAESNPRFGGLFRFDWGAFDTAAGLKYAIGILVVWWLTEAYGFISFVAGVSTLLAWLTDIPGQRRDRILGMVAYALLGVPLTLLGIQLATSPWLLIAATFIVAFVGTMPLARGSRLFMVGWVLIFWFLLVPLFEATEDPSQIVVSFLVGAAAVILLTLLGALVERWLGRGNVSVLPNNDTGEQPALSFVVGYSFTVALTLAVTLFIGWRLLESDPTLVAQGAFFVIGPNSRQTWINGIERAIAVVLGIVVGLWAFQFVAEGTVAYVLIVALISFLTLALMNVNYGAFMFFFVVFMAFWWAESGLDKAYFLAGERIAAELLAIVIAGLAVFSLQWWSKRQQEKHHVRPQQGGI